MQTVADVVDLIAKNAASSNSELAAHAATLQGPRTRGSTTKIGLGDVDPGTKLRLVSIKDGVRVFRGHCEELGGQLGACKLAVALEEGLPVKIRDGAHGPELYIDRPVEEASMDDVNSFSVIVGEFGGETAVFTWHPGNPMTPFKGVLQADTAVKLHNG